MNWLSMNVISLIFKKKTSFVYVLKAEWSRIRCKLETGSVNSDCEQLTRAHHMKGLLVNNDKKILSDQSNANHCYYESSLEWLHYDCL